jgi:putative ABC transport system ATP-binding protein
LHPDPTTPDAHGPAAAPALVSATDVSSRRGHRTLWDQLSFDVRAGTAVAVTGRSGVGKTTLLNCIGLTDRVSAGHLEIDGTDVTRASFATRRVLFRETVGHLFQNYALVDDWSVDANLDVAFIGTGTRRAHRAPLRRSALSRVGLGDVGRRRAWSLSGGERQRVALARLVLRSPRLIVADEPTAALDDDNVEIVLSVLDGLRAAGAAVVVSTHDRRVIDWSDDVIDLTPRPAP